MKRKVVSRYTLCGKWKTKTLLIEIPVDAYGFRLMRELCAKVTIVLKETVSPHIVLRNVTIRE